MRFFFRTILLFPLLLSLSSYADDGLVLQLTISKIIKEKKSDNDITTQELEYNQTILTSFNDDFSMPLSTYYEIRVKNKTSNNEDVNLYLSLNELVEGKPHYVGSDSVNLKVGKNTTFNFSMPNISNISYKVKVFTSYGTLPNK